MYTLVSTSTYSCKNKLQWAVLEFLEAQERNTFKTEEDVKAAIEDYKIVIAEKCKEHPRCKPVGLSVREPREEHDDFMDYQIYVSDVIYLMFYYGAD